MKILKRVLSYLLAMTMLISIFPTAVFAAGEYEYTIDNDYMKFYFNATTGGFSIETAEGHPKKLLDNNIPLLYAEDKTRSNGTSFVTVRIDGDDYIFGQNYGFLGKMFESNLDVDKIVVEDEGRHITIPWTINGVTVTMEAALDNNENGNTTGNVGLSFKVENNSGTEKEVGVRLLLDTALGDRVDAPYFIVGEEQKPTLTETEFSGNALKKIDQIRCVDSLSNPTKLSYIMMYGFTTNTETPNKVILGHWANLANTRYSYSPDDYCDFSNYSNSYRAPDSAAAVYWDKKTLGTDDDSKSFTGELLYGVGSFSRQTDCPVGINITMGRVELETYTVTDAATGESTEKKRYARDKSGNIIGIDVTVNIDNSLDDSVDLNTVSINISADEGKLKIPDEFIKELKNKNPFQLKKGETHSFTFTMEPIEQQDLTAGTFYVTLGGSYVSTATSDVVDFETAAERSVILPSVGSVSAVQMNKINPETVYTDGEKVVTISGKMSAVQSFLTSETGADLVLYNEKANRSVSVKKDNISFTDEKYETLSFSTDETLVVGEYSVMFKIKNETLKQQLGCDVVTCKEKLKVSADEKYRVKSYGLIALVRNTDNKETTYNFYSFDYESEFAKFLTGKKGAKGRISNSEGEYEELTYNFLANDEAIVKHEVLLTVRGKLVQSTDANQNPIWEAKYANGDIIINNMLSYEGDKSLRISVNKDKTKYSVEGDGLIKVIDSINVWRYSWNISVDTGSVYTLDAERLEEKGKANSFSEETSAPTLKFGGAASLIQTIGGFAVSLKYGELSSEWHAYTKDKDSEGSVTYGIGFGGKISLPIKAKKNSSDSGSSGSGSSGGSGEQANVTTGKAYANASDEFSESDNWDAIANMFGAAEAQEYFEQHPEAAGSSGNITSSTGGSAEESLTSAYGSSVAEKTSAGDVQKKDEELPEGKLSAEVDNVLFGEKYNDGSKSVSGTGFVGIDATFALELPEDVLGSFVSNAPGIAASVTINTIDNIYEIEAGLSLKIIECEGVLAFKQVSVKNKDVILPDKIEFYIRDGLKIPIAAPVLFMTGLGGGINGLADTIGGEFDTLPPITLLLYTKLEAISVLEGEFNAKISLEELSLTGNMQLTYAGMEKFMKMDAGIYARWIEPWELSLYGNVNIIDGLIKGGITVTIADNYFYGYVFASLCVPDSIPLVGGKTLRGVEAAVSHEFIGANITIIGIKFGVKYYYGDKVSFGTNIDLSAPPLPGEGGTALANDMTSPYAIGYYGTNVYSIPTKLRAVSSDDDYYTVTEDVSNATGKNALLFEIPYSGTAPKSDDIELYHLGDTNMENPIELVLEGEEEDDETANMLIQNREDGDYIYITVTDDDCIDNGTWAVKYQKNKGFNITSFSVNAVDDIPELDKTKTVLGDFNTVNKDKMTVQVGWDYTTTDLAGKTGTIDIYLTKDKDILTKIQTSENTGDTLGTNVYHKTVDLSTKSATADIPAAFPSGTYYAVTTLTTDDGISLAISDEGKSDKGKSFTNPNLPKSVKDVAISYGGNGELYVKPTDADTVDYTHYIAQIAEVTDITDEGGNVTGEKKRVIENATGQFEKGKSFTFGEEALLQAGKKYKVGIKTLREKTDDETAKTYYYYGSDTVWSNAFVMEATNTPKLAAAAFYANSSPKRRIDASSDEIYVNTGDVIIEYTFDQPVFVEMDLNGGKVYSFKTDVKVGEPSFAENQFREKWTFVFDDLDDGDYVVDFIAFNKRKDSVKGSGVTDENGNRMDEGYFAFTVDTSSPILSLAQRVDKSITGTELKVGANAVFADDEGEYVIKGITEKTAALTIDGEPLNESTAGFEIDAAGNFSIEKTLPEDKAGVTHVISATDKAGNVSRITVGAVRKNGLSYSGLELYANGEKITANENGEKVVPLKNGASLALTAYAQAGNKKIKISNDDIDWSVLYAKNAVYLDDGNVTALTPTETAVKAKLTTASLTTGSDTTKDDGFSDYVVINITNNTKDDLISKIDEATTLLESSLDASESKKSALSDAIETAQDVVKNPSATENDCTAAYNLLSQAMAAFNSTGTGGGGGGSTSFKLSAAQTQHGRVEFSQTTVKKGNSVTITAIPDEGYTVADMLINGVSVGRTDVYTIGAVKENIVVTVIFAEKSDELVFDDVIKTDWYYSYVKAAYERGYMNGTSETRFEPELTLTRAMFVTVLHRIDGGLLTGQNVFEDVSDGAYYANAVAWANANGIVQGISDKEFAPDASITREQMATMLYRYAQYKGYDTTAAESTDISRYTDYAEISDYAVSAMRYTAGTGLIAGKSESTLNPKDTATRAEAATVFVRFADSVK